MSVSAPAATPWMTMKEACAYAHGRSPKFMSREIQRGRLRAARIGERKEYFFRREWIDQWLEDLATPVPVLSRRA